MAEGSENTDIVMHEPLLAEDEPLPTPPESPFVNELVNLMPDSSLGRTPSPSPGIVSKEDPKLLSPGSWNEDKSGRGPGSKSNSKPSSRSNSRPTTPVTTVPAPAPAAPEGGGATSSRGPVRTPSQHSQSSKLEQGSDLEIKPLQKFDSEAKAPDIGPTAPVRNGLITPDEEALHPPSKAPEPKPTKVKTDRAPTREMLSPQNKVGGESREASRPSSKAETKTLPKRQPSPAPSPKPAHKLEPKTLLKPAEAKAIITKPAPKVEPKAEPRQKVVVSSPSSDASAELEELEVK